MSNLVSCLCPTFNRCPNKQWLLEEAIECFSRQDYLKCELIVCNDTPGQRLLYNHNRVRVFNRDERFPTLSDKLIWMIEQAQGDLLCRWDDDDISLPHRLSYSVNKLGDSLEWRANNHWYTPGNNIEGESHNGGNSHTRSIWRREVLDRIGGYPPKRSGDEDQQFNRLLALHRINTDGATIPTKDIFSLYRWGVSEHLSATSQPGPTALQQHYNDLAERPIAQGNFVLRPHWRKDYVAAHQQALKDTGAA